MAVLQVCNFGQKPFKFPPPDGFQPLNAANVRPENVLLVLISLLIQSYNWWTTQSPMNNMRLSMTPDMIWIKNRTDNGTGVSGSQNVF